MATAMGTCEGVTAEQKEWPGAKHTLLKLSYSAQISFQVLLILYISSGDGQICL